MSRGKAIALGLFTLWPFVYMFLFFSFIFFMFLSSFASASQPPGQEEASGFPTAILLIFPLHFLTMFSIVGLLVVYIMHVFKTDRIAADKKALWAVVLFFGNMFAMPVYWYLYIWREPEGPAHGLENMGTE